MSEDARAVRQAAAYLDGAIPGWAGLGPDDRAALSMVLGWALATTPEHDGPPARILGNRFAMALAAAGLVEDIDSARRIILDVRDDKPLTVWVERYADERWLGIVPMLGGVLVRGQPPG